MKVSDKIAGSLIHRPRIDAIIMQGNIHSGGLSNGMTFLVQGDWQLLG
ncbi:hypothetical protein [Oceaniferula spumae]